MSQVNMVGTTREKLSPCRVQDRRFFIAAALLFVARAAVTIIGCGGMSAMAGMPMPGGWTMSMAWMQMPGQTWVAAATTFLGMWVVMVVAMMLPSLMPTLCRYRQAIGGADQAQHDRLTVYVGMGYSRYGRSRHCRRSPWGAACIACYAGAALIAPNAASIFTLGNDSFMPAIKRE